MKCTVYLCFKAVIEILDTCLTEWNSLRAVELQMNVRTMYTKENILIKKEKGEYDDR
jgi:hypothetical protein